ncbi:MAG TPA: hypothetical protein VGH79_05570 [Gaiellaceae bacterium]|jgi:hypothetical protein
MGFFKKIRDAISGPPHVDYGGGFEGGAERHALNEELAVAASDEAELERSQAPEALGEGRASVANAAVGARIGPDQPHADIAALEEAQTAAADEAPEES